MKKLQEIQSELKAPKSQRNNFGKYNYRNCEDILEAVKPLLKKHGCTLTISDEVKAVGEFTFTEATVTITDGKEVIEAKSQAGLQLTKKGMDIAQIFGSSSSYARKYALNGLFLIDDTKDADATNNHSKVVKNVSTDVLEPAKDWLDEKGDKFNKAKDAITKKGFTIADIRKKYKVSKKVEKLLLT